MQTVAPPDVDGRTETSQQWDLDLRAITPIYKGSARPDGIDEAYPFRGPSLRGQLRAWWRAVHPASTTARLRDEEHALFGGIKPEVRASRVQLGLSSMRSTPARHEELRRLVGSDLPYATWVDRDRSEVRYHVDASARLRVRAQAIVHGEPLPGIELLEPALMAMVLFGGSGSRSRRGLGRLWSDELLGKSVADATTLASTLARLAPPPAKRPWPSLAGVAVAWKRGVTHRQAARAAEEALDDLKAMRGMESSGRGTFDGRKRLPQAQADWESVRDDRPLPNAFTAALGMPVLYRSSNGHLVGTTSVQPDGRDRDRLPSPLHVRPIPTASGFAPVFLALRPWFTGDIVAENKTRRTRQKGRLDPQAIDIALDELAARGWEVIRTGGSR